MGLSNPYTFTKFTVVSPVGRTCGTVGEFVITGDGYDVQWCAIGDPTDWPTPATDDARAKQSGKQTMINRFGVVTGIAGNDFFGYVFQETAITKMTYVGGDVVFRFDTFEEQRGCHAYNRYEEVDDKVFFESRQGYHLLEDGQILDLGIGKVDVSYTPQ